MMNSYNQLVTIVLISSKSKKCFNIIIINSVYSIRGSYHTIQHGIILDWALVHFYFIMHPCTVNLKEILLTQSQQGEAHL